MSSSCDDSDQRTPVAEINWVFKNLSHANSFRKKGDVFCSDKFRVASLGNSLWRMELYPNGEIFDDIAVYLRRLRDNQGNMDPITISFELGFEDRNGWNHLQRSESNVLFQTGGSYGYYSFVDPKDSIFLDECLPGDTLTIYCYMFSTTIKSDIRITKALLTTHIPCENIAFIWKIKRFLNRKTDPSKTVCFNSPFSPDATASDLRVTLSMIRILNETYVKIFVEGDSKYFLKCRIWHEECEEDYLLSSQMLLDFPFVESYLPLITESEIARHPKTFLDNGTLKLNCEISLVTDDIECFSQCQSFKTSDQKSVWYNSLKGTTDQKDTSKSSIKTE